MSLALRFCRSLGFSGYQEFKFNLAQGVVNIGYRDSEGIEYVADIAETYERAMENLSMHLMTIFVIRDNQNPLY